MTPKAYVSHSVHGRVRLYIPTKRKDAAYFENVKAKIQSFAGVNTVKINSHTGSILIDHKAHWKHVVEHAASQGLYVLAGTIEDCDEQDRLRGLADGHKIDELTIHRVSFAALLGLAGVQIMRGELLGPASTLLSGALSAWTKMRDTTDRRAKEENNSNP